MIRTYCVSLATNSLQCRLVPPTLAAQRYRPRKFSDIEILRKGIEWISSVNETGTADGEKSFYFTDRFGHHAVRLAAPKLALQLNKGVISGIESVCQRCSNIKDRDRILREKGGRVGYMKLRGFQGTHLRRVRLIQ